MSLRSQIAALCLAALALPASARPFTVDDLLAAEEFGQVGFSPDGARLVFERLIGQSSAGPFDQDVATGYRRSRLYGLDLRRGGPALPLLPARPGEGQVAGPFSPDGSRLAVIRMSGDRYEVGVLTLATGDVLWLGVTPELGWLGQTLAWRNPEELLIAARPACSAPLRLRIGSDRRRDLPELWAATAAGDHPAVRRIGSGGRLAGTPPSPRGALILADARTGSMRQIAEGEFYDLEVSPDGDQVAGMQRLEPIQAPADWPLRVAGDFQRRNLLIANLATGAAEAPCPTCHLSTHLIAWSPDSREVLAYGHPDGAYGGEARYIRLSAGSPPRPLPTPGLTPVIDATSEGYAVPRGAWLEGAPAILARPVGATRADWWRIGPAGPANLTADLPAAPGPLAGRHEGDLVLLAGGAAWRVGAGAPAKRLFAAAGAVPTSSMGLSSRQRLNSATGPAWFASPGAEGGTRRLRSSDGRRIILPAADGRALALVADAPGSARVRRDASGPMALELIWPGGAQRPVLRLNPGLKAVDFAQAHLLPTGDPTQKHVLLTPAGSAPGERAPLVVIPYPGLAYDQPPEPYGRGVGRFSANPEILAAAGFAVLLPALPRPMGEPGAGLADQILAAVDQAAGTGLVDAERLGLVGHSFGGYASLMAATEGRRFRSVIASSAPSDLAAVYGSFDPHLETRPGDGVNLNANYGWAELGQAGLGVPPWRDPDLYRRNSPYFLADRISAPVMLIHGDGDFVRLSQAQQMFSALYRQGKEAELVTYFGEGHIVSSPANLKDMYRHMLGWLERTLAP